MSATPRVLINPALGLSKAFTETMDGLVRSFDPQPFQLTQFLGVAQGDPTTWNTGIRERRIVSGTDGRLPNSSAEFPTLNTEYAIRRPIIQHFGWAYDYDSFNLQRIGPGETLSIAADIRRRADRNVNEWIISCLRTPIPSDAEPYLWNPGDGLTNTAEDGQMIPIDATYVIDPNYLTPHGPGGDWEQFLNASKETLVSTKLALADTTGPTMLLTSRESLLGATSDKLLANRDFGGNRTFIDGVTSQAITSNGLSTDAIVRVPTSLLPTEVSIRAGKPGSPVPVGAQVRIAFAVAKDAVQLYQLSPWRMTVDYSHSNHNTFRIQISATYSFVRFRESGVVGIEIPYSNVTVPTGFTSPKMQGQQMAQPAAAEPAIAVSSKDSLKI